MLICAMVGCHSTSGRDKELEMEAKRRKEEEATILEMELSRQQEDERIVRAESVPGISCQTDVTVEWINQLECKCSALETDNNALRAEVERLHTIVRNHSLDENDLAQDDVKVKFYTGLSTFTLFMHVFTLIAPKLETSHRNALSKLQEFLMTLMRLRLNLLEQDLAYRFGVTQPTVSSICEKWIRVMSVRLEKLIVWPEREVLRKTMPTCFREAFGTRVSVIIDCFEIFAQRPSSLLPRAETWSQYKHHNTVKVLIAITPQGTVSFTSLAWVGRASDKFITNKCGFLEKLIPGDVVLADRGFDISESVGIYRANLHIPAFTKGKTQLSSEDVQETRTIANVRIHVERVIGLLRRKYRILQGPLPTESLRCRSGDPLAPVDRIIRVCCALTNLCPSVVGDDKYEPLPLPPGNE